MAHSKSALKRLKTSEKARVRHKSRRSEMNTLEKKIREAVTGSDKANATELVKLMDSKLDKAVKVGTIHKNKANRKKSQLNKLVSTVK